MTTTTVDTAAAERISEGGTFRRRIVSEAVVLEAAQLMGRAFAGNRRAMLNLEEALSSDDFRAAAFEVLDREMMDRYQDLPATWTEYARRTTVRDFKKKKLIDLMGGQAGLEQVDELAPYPARGLARGLYEIWVRKFGGRFQISWEAIVNDELGELRDLPGALAVGARDTESKVAASLLTDGNGPNGALFNANSWGRTWDEDAEEWESGTGSSNLLAGNPALTPTSLRAALHTISQRRDPENRPIVVQAYVLVVPPALGEVAEDILAAREYREDDGNGNVTVYGNRLQGKVKVVVEPWLAVLDQGANAATTWYLLPAPAASRPALHVAFLRGHEAPDLRVKADTGARVGGGNIPAEEGSFDVDDIQYRVRHVAGGAGTDMIATVASTGAGA